MNKLWAVMIVPVVGIFGAATSVYADSTLVTVNVYDTSLELDVPASPTVLTLNPTASGANFGYVDLTATVGTNNPAGYQLSVTFSDTSLSRTVAVDGTTPTISTLDTLAGGYPVADFTVNRWGHKITGDNYFPVPSSTLSPESWSSDEPVNNAPNVITLAAKADGTIPSGIYETTLTYTLVANVMEPDPVQPYPEDPCDSDVNCDSTSGTTLQGAYELAYTAAHKGMYEETTPGSNVFQYIDSWNGVNYNGEGRDVRFLIQDMTPEICSTATVIGSTALVLDIRDQTSYRIVKAADGRCWMQDNLALNLLDSTVRTTMIDNPSYTNANAGSLTSLFYGNRTNGGQYATTGASNWTSSYSYSAPLVNISNKAVLPTTYHGADESLSSIVASEKWKVGVYYNYCAASAGSYCYGNGTDWGISYDKPNTAIDAEFDICPSGWRMPTSSSYHATDRPEGGEYQTLYDAYPSISGGDTQYTRVRKALRLPLSGYFDDDGSAYKQGDSGYFWSSTRTYAQTENVDGFSVDTSRINPQSGYGRNGGISVRCIAKTGTESTSSGN